MRLSVPLPLQCLDAELLRGAGDLLVRMGERDLLDHGSVVAARAESVCRILGLDPARTAAIARAAMFHDVGKLAIPAAVLDAPGRLSPRERALVRTHAERGAEMLAGIPQLWPAVSIVRHHHERWDGGGYPAGLRAEEIPLGARVVFVCDAFDAMTAPRCYRPTLPVREALVEVRANAGGQFDPTVCAALVASVSEDRSTTARSLIPMP